jgi:hypothetical protein
MNALFDAIASIFKWMTGRNATKNAAPIVQAATAQKAVNAQAATANAIAKKDTNEIRNEISE